MNEILAIDLQIADLLTAMENKKIDFDTFHRRLQYLEALKREDGGRKDGDTIKQ
jgi:hypothetical protein